MKKINTQQLMFEMGRKCTMRCGHCLRGPQEDKAIKFSTIQTVLDQTENIEQIIFTGGEPFLYADMIIKTINYIMEKSIPCTGFYIATNGSVFNMKLMQKLLAFVLYCEKHGADLDENINCHIDISKSPWHAHIPRENESLFKLFSFVGTRDEDKDENYLIPEGNAYLSGYGQLGRPRVIKKFEFDDNYDDEEIIEMLYVNADGICYPDCDLSYNTQRDWYDEMDDMFPDVNALTPITNQIKQYNAYFDEINA